MDFGLLFIFLSSKTSGEHRQSELSVTTLSFITKRRNFAIINFCQPFEDFY